MNHDGKVVISTALDNNGLEKGLKSISGAFGGLTKVVGKAALAITAALGTAAVAVTKQAVDAYADYEQLTGGMETLFKNAASKIAGYADDAFYTAGVSANKYMEIVTSFSASLISSLSGDTEKAADVANMALIDMSDNYNKLGGTLESVQDAYSGFAKQNYTMLDNLKLGYGGTKTEMERLLRDAEAFSGVKYDINNLSDVYKAIHAIQEKLGIAGATATEAEGTITGSANMTKAAWENVLTAISGGGDLDKAINNLVYSVSKYFENIVPVVERSLSGIGQLIEKIAPQLVQTVATALIKAIPSLLNAVYQMIIGLAKGIYQGIIALFKGGSVTTEISAQLNGMTDSADAAADATYGIADATEAAGKAAKKSLAGFDELNTLADQSGGSGSSGVSSGVSIGSDSSGTAVSESVTGVSGAMQEISDKIKEMLLPLKNIDLGPAKTAFDKLRKSLSKLGKTIGTKLEDLWYDVLVPLGKWVIEKAAPKAIDVLSGAFEVLHAILEKVVPIIWDKFLKPLGEWTGKLIISALGFLADALSSVAEWVTKNAEFVAGFAITLGTLYGAFTAIQGAVSIFNGAMALISNPAAPVVLAVVAVAGLVGGILSLSDALEPAPEDVNALTRAEEALIENSLKAAENLSKQKEAAQTLMDNSVSEMEYLDKLATELGTLADASGKVQEKDQARAQFILNELNEALGTEYGMVDGVIQQYDALSSSIKETISAKLAESLLDDYHESYVLAKQKETEALSAFAIATESYNEHLAAMEKAEAEYEDFKEEHQRNVEAGVYEYNTELAYLHNERLADLEEAMEAEWGFFSEAKKTYEETAAAYGEHYDTISTYENAYIAALEGDTDKAIDLLTEQSSAYGTYSEDVSEETKKAVDALFQEALNAGLAAEETKKNFEDGIEGYTQEMVEESEQAYQDALDAYANAYADAQSIGEDMGDGLSDGMENKRPGLLSKAKDIISSMISAMRKEADSHSPSRKTIALGEDMGEGTGIGIENETKNVVSVAKKQTKAAIDAMSAESKSSRLFPVSFPSLATPSIPLLAQGAVLPPNKPFMAIVGDQKHGTNIEAPLSTIQEAVAVVMQDQVSAMMAGFNALLEENRMLRSVVEGIEVGDTVIGEAASRYNQKMAIVKGG